MSRFWDGMKNTGKGSKIESFYEIEKIDRAMNTKSENKVSI